MKKFIKWLLEPRLWWAVIVFILFGFALAGTLCFLVFVDGSSKYGFLGYILYALSAILLIYAVYCLVKLIPSAKSRFREWANKHEFTKKMLEQYGFRTIVFAVVSFAISLAYAVFNLTLGIIWISVWFIALGAYYLLLATMRGGVLLHHRKKSNYATEYEEKTKSCKTYIVCGVWLILLPLALSIVIMEIVGSNMAFVRAGLMIYCAAAYTCYKVVMSVVNFAKAHKGDDMTVRAIRNIGFADALVSILALQTAMFHEFSNGESLDFANAACGAVVCAVTALIGIFMIINGNSKLKLIKNEQLTENTNE